ncbi:hypothetical protein COOONC_16779 [Cooperia oncophora]
MDWSTKPQQTRDSSRGHDRYLYGDAAVGSINRSQAKKAYKEAAKAQREKVELRASEGEPYADEEEEVVLTSYHRPTSYVLITLNFV